MNEKIAIIEKYNLWGAETFDFGFKREEYTEKIVDFIAKKADVISKFTMYKKWQC